MNKKGFIATSLLYSFFLLFCVLILLFIGNLGHESILMNKEVEKINEDLHSIKTLKDAEIGSYFRLNICISADKKDIINSADTLDYVLFSKNYEALLVSKNYTYKLSNLEFLNDFLNSIYVMNGTSKIMSRSLNTSDFTLINNITDNNVKNSIIFSDFSIGTKYLLLNKSNYNSSNVYEITSSSSGNNRSINSNDLTNNNTFIRIVYNLDIDTKIIGGDGIISSPYILEGGASSC